ncbi:MAG: hypothetical protein QOG61_2589 [Candidatus Binataceae bacterium]|jgi:hypothetical protein|nr:hypothetical protein [Candidatus Binataceae bacterium]
MSPEPLHPRKIRTQKTRVAVIGISKNDATVNES